MNYYEHHIGDYAEATAHLSFVEDAAYSRMIRKYYAMEKPLPADLKAVQRLVGARSKEEKDSVDTVLQEFFLLEEDGWHQKRCDAVIEKYHEAEPDREAKRDAEKERQRRTRERRKQLFDILREQGIVPAYDTPMSELQTLVSRVTSQPVTPPVTRDATATQSPVTSNQEKKPQPSAPAFALPDWIPESAWSGYVEMRKRKRAPMTDRARDLKVAELKKLRDAGHDVGGVLDKSTANSWTDVYAPKPSDSRGMTPSADDIYRGAR